MTATSRIRTPSFWLGRNPIFLDAYPLSEYSMYGGVPITEIKKHLLALKREGKLDRVRMLLLTNITFDGIAYDPIAVMQEILAIKPDMIFLWDEAWCAYARFAPVLRRRTAMWAAQLCVRSCRPKSMPALSRMETWLRSTGSNR